MKNSTKYYLASAFCVGAITGVLGLSIWRTALFICLMVAMNMFEALGNQAYEVEHDG
jgi:hypothetical protein